jgi:predicted dehydrogenase
MEAFLHLLAGGDVRVGPMVDLELPAERAAEAYAAINGEQPPMAAVLTYSGWEAPRREVVRVSGSGGKAAAGAVRVAVVGAGSFVRGMHLPNLKRDPNARVELVVARRGDSATGFARQAGGARTATDWRTAIEDADVDLVLVGTRHDTHAEISAAALRAGKAVFVEKPLGLTREQIDDVWAAGGEGARLAIGFNRPFAPLARKLGDQVRAQAGPTHLVYRVNAPLAHDHWLNDPEVGGGRIQGEACHMFDFANWLCGTPVRVLAAALPAPPDVASAESASVTIEYADGSVATVHYSGVGAGTMPKERIEVLRGGRSWVLDDFATLTAYGPDGEQAETADKPDKGHAELLGRVLAACRSGAPFEPGLGAAYAAQSVALAALESIAGARAVEVASAPAAGGDEEA